MCYLDIENPLTVFCQGSILSPVLFNVFMNDLSVQLSDSQSGFHVNSIWINHLLYADDLSLTAPSGSENLLIYVYFIVLVITWFLTHDWHSIIFAQEQSTLSELIHNKTNCFWPKSLESLWGRLWVTATGYGRRVSHSKQWKQYMGGNNYKGGEDSSSTAMAVHVSSVLTNTQTRRQFK